MKKNFFILGLSTIGLLEGLAETLKKNNLQVFSIFPPRNNGYCQFKTDHINQKFYFKSNLEQNNFVRIIIVYFFYLLCLFKVRQKIIKSDYFIGIALFPVIIGLLLKKLGLTNKVIYYCLDYYNPKKFSWNFGYLINRLYIFIERIIVKKVDMIWDLSPKLNIARKKNLKINVEKSKIIIVPVSFSKKIFYSKDINRKNNHILFIGSISKNQGIDMLVDQISNLKQKEINYIVNVIGTGEYLDKFKLDITNQKLTNNFIFHGFVKDIKFLQKISSFCSIGWSIYVPDKNYNSSYTEPGKPKMYLALNVPILISKHLDFSSDVYNNKIGYVCDYDFETVNKILLQHYKSKNNVKKFSQNILKFKDHFSSEKVYKEAIKNTLKII
jgi:glycosyltransferase involved in cell wall biosynthesis